MKVIIIGNWETLVATLVNMTIASGFVVSVISLRMSHRYPPQKRSASVRIFETQITLAILDCNRTAGGATFTERKATMERRLCVD